MAKTNHQLNPINHPIYEIGYGIVSSVMEPVTYEAQELKMIADELGDANINAKERNQIEAVKTMAFAKHLEILNDKVWAERLQKVNAMLDGKIKEMLNIYLELKQKGIHEQAVQPMYEFIATYNNAIPIYNLVDKYFNFLSRCQSEEMLDKVRDEIRDLLPNYIKEKYNFNLLFPKYLLHYRRKDFEHINWVGDRWYNYHSLEFCKKDEDVRYYLQYEKEGESETLDGKASFDYAYDHDHHQLISLLDIKKPVSSLPYKMDLKPKYGNSQIPFKFTSKPFVYEGEHPTDFIQDTFYINLMDVYNSDLCWTKSFKEDYSICYIKYLEEILNIASRLTSTMRVKLLESTISADFGLKRTFDFSKLFPE